MELNWIFFVPALLLLFWPSYAAGAARLRMCVYEEIRYNRGGAARACLRQPWLLIDPIRAFAGAWLVRNAWEVTEPSTGIWNHMPLIGTMSVLAIALGVQMRNRSNSNALAAPIGYTAGLVFAVLPPQVAILVVALAVASLMAFRGWWAFFFFGAMAAAGFGYLILRVNLWMAGSVALLAEPLFLAMLVKRTLAFPVVMVRKKVVVKRVVVKRADERAPISKKTPRALQFR